MGGIIVTESGITPLTANGSFPVGGIGGGGAGAGAGVAMAYPVPNTDSIAPVPGPVAGEVPVWLVLIMGSIYYRRRLA